MPATSITRTYDDLLSLTARHLRPKVVDQIYVGVPLWDWLNKSGRKETVSGGTHIDVNVRYRANTTARSFSGYDNIDLTPQDNVTRAEYTPREYDVSVVISRREKQQNAGKEQLVNLLTERTEDASMALVDLLNEKAFASQSGDDLDGLQTLIGDSAGVVGSINESSNSWWAPQRDTSARTAADFKDSLLNIFNDCSRVKKGFPDLILTTQAVWEIYHGLIEDQGEFRLDADHPAIGFGQKVLTFMGEPFVWDADCPADHVYLLNSKALKLKVYKGADFDLGAMKEPVDQHAFARSYYWMGNMCIAERRACGVMTNVT